MGKCNCKELSELGFFNDPDGMNKCNFCLDRLWDSAKPKLLNHSDKRIFIYGTGGESNYFKEKWNKNG